MASRVTALSPPGETTADAPETVDITRIENDSLFFDTRLRRPGSSGEPPVETVNLGNSC